jgi:phosphoserine phosphatase
MTLAAVSAAAFLDLVLELRPRLATFDCDGTLWPGDAGEGFFSWELGEGLVSDEIVRWARQRYADYRAGRVPEDVMCGEMVTMHRGLPEAHIQAAATRYFDTLFLKNIFPEMRELVRRLRQQGCEVWAVSSTNEWIIKAAMRHFEIPENRIIASAVEIDEGVITDHLIRIPSGTGKPLAIQAIIQRDPDIAFGNSIWDAEMLKISQHAFAVNPNPDLKDIAVRKGWRVYWPTQNLNP